MKIFPVKQFCLMMIAFIVSLTGNSQLVACPGCSAPSLTLTDQVTEADAVVLVEWVSAKEGEGDSAGTTTYRIKDIHKSPKNSLKVGDTVTLLRHRTGEADNLFLLLGSMGAQLDWASPLEVTNASYQYITNAPSLDVEMSKRLLYFIKYLEFADRTVADDAYYEFAGAPYEDVKKIAKDIPRKKVLKWLSNPETPRTHIGLYGVLLGVYGDKADAPLLKEIILDRKEELRLGLDGIMFGYLLLTGEKGLVFLEETNLKTLHIIDKTGKPLLDEKGEKKNIPFSDVYATMQTLRSMWTYGDGQISKERLRQSLRILLNRPSLADLVIVDLSRWKDWSVQEKLMKLYDTEDYDVRSIKSSIVRYFLACAADAPKDSKLPEPKHVKNAKKHLKTLEEKDPKIVKSAKRYFFVR